MASSHLRGGVWYVRFRFNRHRFNQSLDTDSERTANRLLADIEDTISLLERGRLGMPEGITKQQAWQFIRSGGRQTILPKVVMNLAHHEAWNRYFESFPAGAKADETFRTERTHRKHFLELLGRGVPFAGITAAELRKYIKAREKEKGLRGKTVRPDTIKKELTTFRQLWNFTKSDGLVQGDNPVDGIKKLLRGEEKNRFQTFDEIKKLVDRGGLKKQETEELWGCLFLRANEVNDLLDYVQMTAAEDFVYPMFCLVALTGCRRSEMMRSEIADFTDRIVKLREKKRKHGKTLSFRQVDQHPRLRKVMKEWFRDHPGGQFTIAKANGERLSPKETDGIFKRTLKGSKWAVISGFHCLRHSFASNLAKSGIPQAVIDGFLGHQTEEMRERYRHLFPEETRGVLESVF